MNRAIPASVENRVTTGINRRQFGRGALAASTALATAGRALPAAAAPVKIRVGWVVVPASSAPPVLAKKDILKHFGQSYVDLSMVAETAKRPG